MINDTVIPKADHFNYPLDENGNLTVPVQQGDFILIRHTNVGGDLLDKAISFGQSLRFREKDKEYSYYTHAALIVNPQGEIIEALANGVVKSAISKYKGYDFTLVRINSDLSDRNEATNFAYSCLGDGYGWTTILSIAFCLLTGLKFSFGFDGEEICSGLVARALERTAAIFQRDPSHIMPADLAKYFKVI